MPKFSFPQLTGEDTATEGFVHVHFSNACDSSDKDLMIVTGGLQRSAYINDCDRRSPMFGLQNGHKPHKSF